MTAKEFLREADATIDIRFARNQDTPMCDKFIVSMRRGDEDYSFPFYSGTYNWMNGNTPNESAVLYYVQKEDPGDMGEFIEAHGYEIYNAQSFRRVEETWKDCKNEYDSMLRLFGPDLLQKLRESQEDGSL